MFALGYFDLNSSLGAIITIISSLAAAIVSIINAIKQSRTSKKVTAIDNTLTSASNTLTSADEKLEKVHKNTNGDRDRLMAEISRKEFTIDVQQERIRVLEAQVNKIPELEKQLKELADRRVKQ